jgi:hypothetical protein
MTYEGSVLPPKKLSDLAVIIAREEMQRGVIFCPLFLAQKKTPIRTAERVPGAAQHAGAASGKGAQAAPSVAGAPGLLMRYM